MIYWLMIFDRFYYSSVSCQQYSREQLQVIKSSWWSSPHYYFCLLWLYLSTPTDHQDGNVLFPASVNGDVTFTGKLSIAQVTKTLDLDTIEPYDLHTLPPPSHHLDNHTRRKACILYLKLSLLQYDCHEQLLAD